MSFTPVITNKKNFIYQYDEWAGNSTDCCQSFHEIHALYLLSLASFGLDILDRPLNMYAIVYGMSGLSRKSTAMKRMREVLMDNNIFKESIGRVGTFTQEGLISTLARNDGRPTSCALDEMSTILEIMVKQYGGGIKATLLTLATEQEYQFVKSDKGAGKKKEPDIIKIDHAHLSLIGNATLGSMEKFTEQDIEDGFLGRFRHIVSNGKNPSYPHKWEIASDPFVREKLADRLEIIANASLNCKEWSIRNHAPTVDIETSALEACGEYQDLIESYAMNDIITENKFALIQRMPSHAKETAALIELGEVDPLSLSSGPLVITEANMLLAIQVCKVWQSNALKLAGKIGISKQEIKTSQIMDVVRRAGGKMPRSAIMRNLNLSRRDADEIFATLVAREMIYPDNIKVGESNKSTQFWCLTK